MKEYVLAMINSLGLRADITEDKALIISDPRTGEIYKSEQTVWSDPSLEGWYPVPGIRYVSDNGNEIRIYSEERDDVFKKKAPIACFSGFGLSGKDPVEFHIEEGIEDIKYIELPGKNGPQIIRFFMGVEGELVFEVTRDKPPYDRDIELTQNGKNAIYGKKLDDSNELENPHTISLDDFTEDKCAEMITQSINNSSNSTEDTIRALEYCKPLLRICASEFKEHWKRRSITVMNEYRRAMMDGLELKAEEKEDGTVEISNPKTGEIYKMEYGVNGGIAPGARYTSDSGKEIWLYSEEPGIYFENFFPDPVYNDFGIYIGKTWESIYLPCDGRRQEITFITKAGKPLKITVATGDYEDYHDLELTQKGDQAVYGKRDGKKLEDPHTISLDDFTEDKCIEIITQCLDNYHYANAATKKTLEYTMPVLRLYARDFIEAWKKRIRTVKEDDTDYGSSTHSFNR